ncbi:phytase [Marinoscillum furvescens]|uniref:3-phytase n=1 Tax=Marinoscillum furvescens DSM 4134 TaxID=1122208 RepID=A0A3D9L4M8_MARFU|nr:phytase [Marinoscillum furvescens]REE00469.1 3-phytase [Marinoscillum furvescens DSM 4134]
MKIYPIFALALATLSCSAPAHKQDEIKPQYITDQVLHDSDDPAIWVHPTDPSQSLILGTDKHETEGGLYAFDLKGKMNPEWKAFPLKRPNNVDIAYGFQLDSTNRIDVAVCSERGAGGIRVFKLPELTPIDGGGLSVFEDTPEYNQVMGVALYKNPQTEELFAIASRKAAPEGEPYLYQYQLIADSGKVRHELVRKFGAYSGTKEIEAIAVDAALGYIYYSDEHFGVRKYYADPERGNEELSVFGTEGFADDREGISIYKTGPDTGYLLVSDQGAHQFRVYSRSGTTENPHLHTEVAILPVTAQSSDGSEVVADSLNPDFPKGLFVAMSDNKTFEIYDWRDLAERLK